jgi:hypothetical protein
MTGPSSPSHEGTVMRVTVCFVKNTIRFPFRGIWASNSNRADTGPKVRMIYLMIYLARNLPDRDSEPVWVGWGAWAPGNEWLRNLQSTY